MKKKKVKKVIIGIVIVALIALLAFIVYKSVNTGSKEVKEVKIVSKIDKYGYKLKENKTKEYKKMFEELEEILTTDVTTAISSYYTVIASEITGNYFSAILQQKEVKALLDSATLNSTQFNTADIVKFMNASFENVYESNLSYLENGDEASFDITGRLSK